MHDPLWMRLFCSYTLPPARAAWCWRRLHWPRPRAANSISAGAWLPVVHGHRCRNGDSHGVLPAHPVPGAGCGIQLLCGVLGLSRVEAEDLPRAARRGRSTGQRQSSRWSAAWRLRCLDGFGRTSCGCRASCRSSSGCLACAGLRADEKLPHQADGEDVLVVYAPGQLHRQLHAMWSAFSVVTLSQVFGNAWYVWLWPTIVGVPAIVLTVGYYARKFAPRQPVPLRA